MYVRNTFARSNAIHKKMFSRKFAVAAVSVVAVCISIKIDQGKTKLKYETY